MTGPSAPTAETETAADAAPTDTVVITQDGIKTSGIGLAQAASGGVAGIILASATVEATPDAEAVLTARAAGTVTRIFKRSEEHTSELQSLMRISYAVFCLKKKNSTISIRVYAQYRNH